MKTKKLLEDWKSFLENELLIEISLKKLKAKFPEADIDYNLFPSKLKGNVRYLDVIKNTLEDENQRNPSTDEFIKQFDFFVVLESLLRKNDNLTIVTPKKNNFHTILHKFKSEDKRDNITATFKDIEDWKNKRISILEKGNEEDKNEFFQKTLDTGEGSHFELITETSDWLVYRPYTIAGSKSLCRSYWNGTKLEIDTTYSISSGEGEKVGEMKWCTNAAGSGNYFYSYNNKTKFLVYFIKKDDLKLYRFRKACVGFNVSNRDSISFTGGDAQVDANNNKVDENLVEKNVFSKIPGIVELIKNKFIEKNENFTVEDLIKKYEEIKEKLNLSKSISDINRQYNINEQSLLKIFMDEISPALAVSNEKNEIAQKLLELNNEYINENLILDINCTTGVLTQVANTISDKFAESHASGQIENKLDSYNKLRYTMLILLQHSNCDENIVLKIYNDVFKLMKEPPSIDIENLLGFFGKILSSKKITEDIQNKLYLENKDESFMEQYLANRPSIQKNILKLLSSTNNIRLLRQITYSNNFDNEVLREIVKNADSPEKHFFILKKIPAANRYLSIFIDRGNWEACKFILKYKQDKLSDDLKTKIFNKFKETSEAKEAIEHLLKHDLPGEVLREIASMFNGLFLRKAVMKRNFPSDLLIKLLDSNDPEIVSFIMTQRPYLDIGVQRKKAYIENEDNDIYDRLGVLIESEDLEYNYFRSFFYKNIEKYGLGLEELDFDWTECFMYFADEIAKDRRKILFFANILENTEFETSLSSLIETPNCPKGILEDFSESENNEIRRAVAANTNTEKDVLETLSYDKDSYVRDAAKESLSMLESNKLKNFKSKKINESLIKSYIKFYL